MSGLEIPTIMMFAGTAASAGSQMMAAGERSASAQFESEQYQRQAEAAKTASMQEETARRRDLNSNLQTIMAIRAGRGVGSGSPTAMAVGALGTVGSAAYRYSSLNFPKAPAGRSIGDPTQIGSLY